MHKIGFIGAGNMATALIEGILGKNICPADHMTITDINQARVIQLSEQLGIKGAKDPADVANASKILILAVKPDVYPTVIKSIASCLTKDQILVSIAPGISLENLQNMAAHRCKIVRTMPNTPAMVGEGMTALTFDPTMNEEDRLLITQLFSAVGLTEEVPEKLMDTVTAICGSSPAYAFMFIEAMADAAVLGGMPRQMAYKLSSQALLGASKMVLSTGKHPGELKDMVASPGGTTIEAIKVLEIQGFRSSIIQAVAACQQKSSLMGK